MTLFGLRVQQVLSSCSSIKENGFINYFGLQRFGTGSAATHQVGKLLLKVRLTNRNTIFSCLLSRLSMAYVAAVELMLQGFLYRCGGFPLLLFTILQSICIYVSYLG